MGGMRFQNRGNKHSMTRPSLINFIQSGIILSNNQDLILMILPGNTNQPIVQELQVRLTNNTNNDSPISTHKGNRLFEGVILPF